VLIEPLACCIHAALRGGATKDDVVVVVGAGTIGLLTVAAIRMFTPPRRLIAVAKHPTRMVVVGTFRESEVGTGTPVAGLLADLRREANVARVSLGGLGDLDVLALMESGVGRPLERAEWGLRDALLAETDGNPFFVLELLRHLAETGGFRQDASGRWEASAELNAATLPVSVQEVIGERVAHLGQEAVRVLSLAAVIGRDFELGVLASASDTAEGALLDMLDKATAARLVADVGAGRLVHAVVTHVSYNTDDLTPIIHRGDSNALANRFGGRAPIFPGEILGDQRNGNSVVRVTPAEITTGNERYAQSREIFGRNEQQMPGRRKHSVPVRVVLHEDIVEPAISVQGYSAGKGNRGNPGNGSEPVLDSLLNARDAGIVSHIGIRNGNAKCLKLGGARESRICVRQHAESANH